MAQGGQIPASELETGGNGSQQGGFPRIYTAGKQQHDFPTANDVTTSDQTYHHGDPPAQAQPVHGSSVHKNAKVGICGLVFWLVIAVIILLVLAVVEGGLLGSKVAKYKNFCSKLESNASISTSSSSARSSPPISTTSTASSIASSQSPVIIEPLPQPKDDCQTFGKQYAVKVADTDILTNFEINCNTDYHGGDISSFYSPSLLTCMEGCTLFNWMRTVRKDHQDLNCSGVSYGISISSIENCFLKFGDAKSVMTRLYGNTYARVIQVG